MLGLLGALDPYKHKLNQTGGVLVDGDSAAISKHMTDSEAGNADIVSRNLYSSPAKVMATKYLIRVSLKSCLLVLVFS